MNGPQIPRLVIAAPHGRSGKTTITMGLVAALTDLGYIVQPFKKGPDYIDPSWLGKAARRPCRNLDRFFSTAEEVVGAFIKGAAGADVAIIEGNHGLFDGLDREGSGSTAEVARSLSAPVVLVVDATRMTRSVAAMVCGFMDFDAKIQVAGVILNQVSSPRHREMLTGSIEQYCGIPVLGVMPKSHVLRIPDRHLGLVPADEEASRERVLEWSRRKAAEHLDLKALLALAGTAGPLPVGCPVYRPGRVMVPAVRIGYFLDEAFSFYYPENLEALRAAGAQLVPINALTDHDLPEVDGLYLGGGFPEMFAGRLEANAGVRAAIRRAVDDDMPVYAECGGLMYLCRSISSKGKQYAMAGALPADVLMEDSPQGHGYTIMEVSAVNPFFPVGTLIKGHEFHHSRLVNLDRDVVRFAYTVRKGTGIDRTQDGLLYRNVLAGYNHLYAPAVPDWAEALVTRAAQRRQVGQVGVVEC